jgi:hypothetical protein
MYHCVKKEFVAYENEQNDCCAEHLEKKKIADLQDKHKQLENLKSKDNIRAVKDMNKSDSKKNSLNNNRKSVNIG